jgi:hypothetical protein
VTSVILIATLSVIYALHAREIDGAIVGHAGVRERRFEKVQQVSVKVRRDPVTQHRSHGPQHDVDGIGGRETQLARLFDKVADRQRQRVLLPVERRRDRSRIVLLELGGALGWLCWSALRFGR